MSVNQRIIEFIEEVGIQDILKKTHLGKSNLYKLRESGSTTTNTLDEIFVAYPLLSPNWVFKGIGNKWILENSIEENTLSEAREESKPYEKVKKETNALVTEEEVMQKQLELLVVELKRLEKKVELLEVTVRHLKKEKK